MPSRIAVARELADILKVLAHPDRVRMVEELRSGELDVSTLAERLQLAQARVSQHLTLLRSHRLVGDRRLGRQHFYHLTQPELAQWIVSGLDFVEGRPSGVDSDDISAARKLWGA